MLHTPFFPAWRASLAPMGSRIAQALQQVRSHTLCQLETCLGPWVPTALFPKARDHENSRDHHYTRWRTFWCMLWQSLNPDASGREVVRQLQALFRLENGPPFLRTTEPTAAPRPACPWANSPKAWPPRPKPLTGRLLL